MIPTRDISDCHPTSVNGIMHNNGYAKHYEREGKLHVFTKGDERIESGNVDTMVRIIEEMGLA